MVNQPMSSSALAHQVAQKVQILYAPPPGVNPQEISKELEAFQKSKQAAETSLHLLSSPDSSNFPETVTFFAANTLVAKIQAGSVPFDPATESLLRQLLKTAPGKQGWNSSAIRALSTAWADYILLNYDFDSNVVEEVKRLPLPSLLSTLMVLSEDAMSKKLYLQTTQRARLVDNLLILMPQVLEVCGETARTDKNALFVLQHWLKLGRFHSDLRKGRRMASLGVAYRSPCVGMLKGMGLFSEVCNAFQSSFTPDAMAQVCGNVLSEALLLTTDYSADLEFVGMIGTSLASLGKQLMSAVPAGGEKFLHEATSHDHSLLERVKLYCRVLSEFGRAHFFDLLCLDNNDMNPVLTELMKQALYFVKVRHIDIASTTLDFWFHLLSSFSGASDLTDEEDQILQTNEIGPVDFGSEDDFPDSPEGFEEEFVTFGGRGQVILSSKMRLEKQNKTRVALKECMEELVKSLIYSLVYPANVDEDEGFELDSFSDFRDIVISVIQDSVSQRLLDPAWIIGNVGDALNSGCQQAADGSVDCPWQTAEGCFLVLAAVAPRMLLGDDQVIPRALDLIPVLRCPSSGQPALLLRMTMGRLVSYTASYLGAVKTVEKGLPMLKFIAQKLIPDLNSINGDSVPASVIEKSQAQLADAVQSLLEGVRLQVEDLTRDAIGELLAVLSSVVLNERVSLKARVTILTGCGRIIETLPMECILEYHSQFVHLCSQPVQDLLAGRTQVVGNKPPPALEIFFASLAMSTPYQLSGFESLHADPLKHPILNTLEAQWGVVEQVMLRFATQFPDVGRACCHAFFRIYANSRNVCPKAPVFIKTLEVALQCFRRSPHSHWMEMVKFFVNMFGELTRIHKALVGILCELCKEFTVHANKLVLSNLRLVMLSHDESKMVAETFIVLGEVLRFVDLVEQIFQQTSQFVSEAISTTVVCLREAEVDARTLPAISAQLFFLERVVTWIDPPCIVHAAEDTERVAKAAAAQMRNVLSSPLPQVSGYQRRGASQEAVSHFEHIVIALSELWVCKDTDSGLVKMVSVGVANCLRLMLCSSLQEQALGSLRAVAQKEWTFLPADKVGGVVESLMRVRGNSRNFGQLVSEAAVEFGAWRRKAMHQ